MSRWGPSEAIGQSGFDKGEKDIRPVLHPSEKDDHEEQRPGKQQGRQGQPFLSAILTGHNLIIMHFEQDQTRDFDRSACDLTDIKEQIW